MRKGQASMEFLMTYGWAIFALILALGALTYFGILNPSRALPEKCVFGNGLTCKDVLLNRTVVNMTMVNGVGQTIYSVSAVPETGSFTGGCITVPNATVVSDGDIRIDCNITSISPPLSVGKGTKLKIKITFLKKVGGYTHVSLGDIYTIVQ